jgi:hypothetical protein
MTYEQSLCLERGGVRKLWKAEVDDRVVVTLAGDAGTPLSAKKKTFRHPSAAQVAVNKEIAQRLREGYRPISPKELTALQAKAKPSTAASQRGARAKSVAGKRDAVSGSRTATKRQASSAAKPARKSAVRPARTR